MRVTLTKDTTTCLFRSSRRQARDSSSAPLLCRFNLATESGQVAVAANNAMSVVVAVDGGGVNVWSRSRLCLVLMCILVISGKQALSKPCPLSSMHIKSGPFGFCCWWVHSRHFWQTGLAEAIPALLHTCTPGTHGIAG